MWNGDSVNPKGINARTRKAPLPKVKQPAKEWLDYEPHRQPRPPRTEVLGRMSLESSLATLSDEDVERLAAQVDDTPEPE